MEIRTESWQELHNKLGTSDASPPTPVYVAVYALTRGAGIEVSYARRELRDASTIWRNWVLTDDGHLVHSELEFAAENYDSYAEDSLRNMGNQDSTIDPVVHKGLATGYDRAAFFSRSCCSSVSVFHHCSSSALSASITTPSTNASQSC